MKKIIISAFLCFGLIAPIVAQETVNSDPFVNKRGIPYLPQAGDFALGIEAIPIGSLINLWGGGSTSTFDGLNNGIYGKYFIQDNQAIRARLGLNFTQNKYKQSVTDDHAVLLDPSNIAATTIDVKKVVNQFVSLDLGYEFRRGKGRVQGFYGGELLLGYGRVKDVYNYGNPMTSANQAPTTYDFGSNMDLVQGYRMLENKRGPEFKAGLGAFVGVEYFIAPQFSIGGELGLGFIYSIKGQDEIKTEDVIGGNLKEYNYRARSADQADFTTGIQTNTKGSIFLMFHF